MASTPVSLAIWPADPFPFQAPFDLVLFEVFVSGLSAWLRAPKRFIKPCNFSLFPKEVIKRKSIKDILFEKLQETFNWLVETVVKTHQHQSCYRAGRILLSVRSTPYEFLNFFIGAKNFRNPLSIIYLLVLYLHTVFVEVDQNFVVNKLCA